MKGLNDEIFSKKENDKTLELPFEQAQIEIMNRQLKELKEIKGSINWILALVVLSLIGSIISLFISSIF